VTTTITNLATFDGASGTVGTSGTITGTPTGVLLSIGAYTSSGSANAPAPSVSGCGLTWTLVAQQDGDTSGTDRSQGLVFYGSGTFTSGVITVDFGGTPTRFGCTVDGITGGTPTVTLIGTAGGAKATSVAEQVGTGDITYSAIHLETTSDTPTPPTGTVAVASETTQSYGRIWTFQNTGGLSGNFTMGTSDWVSAIFVSVSTAAAGNHYTGDVSRPTTAGLTASATVAHPAYTADVASTTTATTSATGRLGRVAAAALAASVALTTGATRAATTGADTTAIVFAYATGTRGASSGSTTPITAGLTASATVTSAATSNANLHASAGIVAAADVAHPVAVTRQITTAITGAATRAVTTQTTLAGSAVVGATAARATAGSTSLVVGAQLTTEAIVTSQGQIAATVDVQTTVVAGGARSTAATASVPSSITLAVAAVRGTSTATSLPALAHLSAAATVTSSPRGDAALDAAASTTASATAAKIAATAVHVGTAVVADATVGHYADAEPLTAVVALTTSGTKVAHADGKPVPGATLVVTNVNNLITDESNRPILVVVTDVPHLEVT
jgi:hypothetical protein